MRKKLLVILIALPLVLFFVLEMRFFVDYLRSRRTPNVFLLPDNHTGWVIIKYDDPACPPLIEEDGVLIYQITTGSFCTSSSYQGGWAEDGFYYAMQTGPNLASNPQGGANHIWHEFTRHIGASQNGGEFTYYIFYVGDKLPPNHIDGEIRRIDERLSPP